MQYVALPPPQQRLHPGRGCRSWLSRAQILVLTCKAPSGLDLVYARGFKDYVEKAEANILHPYG